MNKLLTTKGQLTSDRIAAAARNKLVEDGFDALVMRELAEALQMKLGNLHYYYATKDDLVLSVLEAEAQIDLEAIAEGITQHNDAETAFRAIVGNLVARWRGQSGMLFLALNNLAAHNEMYRQLYNRIYLRFYDALEGLLKEMNPALTGEEISLRVRLITALIDGSSMQIRVGKKHAYLERVRQQAMNIAHDK